MTVVKVSPDLGLSFFPFSPRCIKVSLATKPCHTNCLNQIARKKERGEKTHMDAPLEGREGNWLLRLS